MTITDGLHSVNGKTSITSILVPNMSVPEAFGTLPTVRQMYEILKNENNLPMPPRAIRTGHTDELINWTVVNAGVRRRVVEKYFDEFNRV